MSVYFVYALSFFNCISTTSAQIVLSLYALRLGATPFEVGLLAGSFSLFPTFFAVTAGRLVDRHGARWPMLVGSLAGSLGLLAPYFVSTKPALYIASTLCGVAIICVNLGAQNLVGMLSTPQTRARDFSNYMLSTATAMMLAPLIGGFSIDHFGHAATCLYLSLLAMAPVVLLLVGGDRLPGGTRKEGKSSGGILSILADPVVRRTLITGSLVNTGINLYLVYMPVYGHSIGFTASTIGMVMALNSSAAFVVRFALPRLIKRMGEQRVLTYAFFMGAVSLLIIPLIHNAPLLALISFIFGLGVGCGPPIVIMMMYSNSKDGRSGESLGLKFTVNQLTKLASPIIFGAIASGVGLTLMFWINAAVMAAGGAVNRDRAPPNRKTTS